MPLPTNNFFLASFNTFLFTTIMADLEQYSSDDASVDSREYSSQDSKLEFSEDEETLITRMYNLVGERWSLIAGRIPGRSAEEIEKYWTSRYSTSE
ncbi:Transcription factor CPC like [Actinidia chinensis var. chinensis]|uniref:Transcription factor CPC like n=1 Tax=Actinidia chinensis var. chinensis TaxID=1590841 RepID=A0A2R6PQJ4_ACTCC|nr:Transcription factor CPC like [Actinidia chinensis var. chinensis]